MKTPRLSSLTFALLLGILGASSTGFSQSAASLRGVVTDPQGATVSEAAVKLTNSQTGLVRQTLTNANGEYQFLQIPPGAYVLGVEKPGFATVSRSDVNLLVNTPTTLDLRMECAKTVATVSVSAEASTINTVDASVGNAFSEQQVRALPLQ